MKKIYWWVNQKEDQVDLLFELLKDSNKYIEIETDECYYYLEKGITVDLSSFAWYFGCIHFCSWNKAYFRFKVDGSGKVYKQVLPFSIDKTEILNVKEITKSYFINYVLGNFI